MHIQKTYDIITFVKYLYIRSQFEKTRFVKRLGMKRVEQLQRTIDILELIARESKGLSLTEIASELDIPITSASDIINALFR